MKNHFLYTDQDVCKTFLHNGLIVTDQSVECQIMDWADDIANAYADINDGVKAKLIDIDSLETWASSQTSDPFTSSIVDELIKSIEKSDIERLRATGIGNSICATVLTPRTHQLAATTARYSIALTIEPEIKKRCEVLKAIARDIVIFSPQVQQIEMKTSKVLKTLFELFYNNYACKNGDCVNLLAKEIHSDVMVADGNSQKARIICDHLAGMSDDFAIRTYRRLNDITFGSLGDFV